MKEEDVAKEIVCGPDPERYLAKINEYVEAGYDHVWLHQVGPDQEGFFRFSKKRSYRNSTVIEVFVFRRSSTCRAATP